MTTWEKIKEFKENHEEEIAYASDAGLAIINSMIWYRLGKINATNKFERGINNCVLVNPEIRTMIEDASREVRKRLK